MSTISHEEIFVLHWVNDGTNYRKLLNFLSKNLFPTFTDIRKRSMETSMENGERKTSSSETSDRKEKEH